MANEAKRDDSQVQVEALAEANRRVLEAEKADVEKADRARRQTPKADT